MSILEQFSLVDRVIIITGASSGIGHGIALACAEAGATIVGIGRNPERLAQLHLDLKKISDRNHLVKSFDVINFAGMEDLFAEIVISCGKIGGFVHAAGIAVHKPIKVMRANDYFDLFEVNVVAGMEMMRHLAAKKNLASGGASVVLISSVSSLCGEPGLLGYAISKGGINSATKTLALELSKQNIRVNAIVPGQILDTDMGQQVISDLPADAQMQLQKKHPLGFGKVNDLLGGVVFYLSPASSWITGTTLCIDGGYCI